METLSLEKKKEIEYTLVLFKSPYGFLDELDVSIGSFLFPRICLVRIIHMSANFHFIDRCLSFHKEGAY